MLELDSSTTRAPYQDPAQSSRSFFYISNVGITLQVSASLQGTSPTFGLYNPKGSGVNLVVLEIAICFTAAPAVAVTMATVISQPINTVSGVTAGNVRNAYVGGPYQTARGVPFSAATWSNAAIPARPLGSILAAGAVTPPAYVDEVGGRLILPPGMAMAVNATAANSVLGSIKWEEVLQ